MKKSVSLCHWGPFEAEIADGKLVSARPWGDSGADPDMIGAWPELVYSRHRIDRPHIREGWLEMGARSDGAGRGRERMVPVDWDVALDLVAGELVRIRDEHGHTSIFAGSYGWSSAGRFHHARTQLRRFLGAFGGFTDQTGNYSWGAAQVLLPHILGDYAAVSNAATSWDSIIGNTDVFVAFGGLHPKNWRVTSGGAGFHHMPQHIRAARGNGTKFIVISPMADDSSPGSGAEWIAPRPGSDTAIMLALCYAMLESGRADRDFLDRYCTGAEPFIAYLRGETDGQAKTLSWAAKIADVPLETLQSLSSQMSSGRVMLTASWSLQRAHRGEQTYWALIALAAMLGQIGLPGGGFTFGYGSMNAVGQGARRGLIPSMATLGNPGGMSIPVARIADMLERPGKTIPYDGGGVTYPDTKMIYWAGGNPYHHAQDLFRLERLWARPDTVVVHEQFWTATARRADIVLPATTSVERRDIGGTSRDPHVFFMPRLIDPVGQARNDYDIFTELASRLGCEAAYTENRSEEAWLRHLWQASQDAAAAMGIEAPDFDALVEQNVWHVPPPDEPEIYLADFRADPVANALRTPSGKIEISSETIASFDYPDMPDHPMWAAPQEWLGNAPEDALALLTRQPKKFLHSQLAQTSLGGDGSPGEVVLHPDEAQKRGLAEGDLVRVSSPRGACLAMLTISQGCRHGVAAMETGRWFAGNDGGQLDPAGNPNALTLDIASSTLSQASAAQSCLVRIEKAER
jgi:biotin/methionine sulfoxide reductase